MLDIQINAADLVSILANISKFETNKELAMPQAQINQYAKQFFDGPKYR